MLLYGQKVGALYNDHTALEYEACHNQPLHTALDSYINIITVALTNLFNLLVAHRH